MEFPFVVIESSTTSRNEFYMTDGYQPTHALFYLKKGSFEIEINGSKQEVSKGDCYILPDFVYHRRKVIAPIEFIYIKFAFNEKCPYTMEIPLGKIVFLDEARFLSSITILERLITIPSPLHKGYREHLLLDILFQIYDEQHPAGTLFENPNCHDAVVGAAVTFIEENLTEKITVTQICHSIGTNPSTLNFKFRREFNCPVGQYILRERMKKAKKLLVSTSYSIGEIAKRCGFENVYYFSNSFRKHQGCTPTEYRK